MTSKRHQLGQGMTEYIIIVALIAIAAIGVYRYFGSTVRNQTAAMAKELSGEDGTTASDSSRTASQAAQDDAAKDKTLKTFTKNNNGAGGS